MGLRLSPFQGAGCGRLPREKVGFAGQIYFFKKKIFTWWFPQSGGKNNLANVLQTQIFILIFKHEQILLKMFLTVRAPPKANRGPGLAHGSSFSFWRGVKGILADGE